MPEHDRRHTTVSCAKTAEPFRLWVQIPHAKDWKELFLGERTRPGVPDDSLQ